MAKAFAASIIAKAFADATAVFFRDFPKLAIWTKESGATLWSAVLFRRFVSPARNNIKSGGKAPHSKRQTLPVVAFPGCPDFSFLVFRRQPASIPDFL